MASILVLDDVAEAAHLVERILARKGHQVHVFSDEDEALRFVRENLVDLVVLDQQLRRMEGLEVLQELGRIQPHPRVIMLTGFPTREKASRALEFGAAAYCSKPIDISELEETVEEVLRGGKPGAVVP